MEKLQQIAQITKSTKDRTDLWGKVIQEFDCKTICEIGVFKGVFAGEILRSAPGIEKYYMVDPWKHLAQWNKPANKSDTAFDQIFACAMEATTAFKDKTIVLRDESITALKSIANESLDFAYIDGDHTLRGITIDLINVLPKLKKDGLIAGDDFTKNVWQHGDKYSPTEVFPFAVHFAEAHSLPIITLPWNQFCICNNPDRGFHLIDLEGYGNLDPSEIYRFKRKRWKFF